MSVPSLQASFELDTSVADDVTQMQVNGLRFGLLMAIRTPLSLHAQYQPIRATVLALPASTAFELHLSANRKAPAPPQPSSISNSPDPASELLDLRDSAVSAWLLRGRPSTASEKEPSSHPPDPSAWEALCEVSPEVQSYFGSWPDGPIMRQFAGLPAIRNLASSKRTCYRAGPDYSSKRRTVAALKQMSGVLQSPDTCCLNCKKGKGPWIGCVVESISGSRSCANCYYTNVCCGFTNEPIRHHAGPARTHYTSSIFARRSSSIASSSSRLTSRGIISQATAPASDPSTRITSQPQQMSCDVEHTPTSRALTTDSLVSRANAPSPPPSLSPHRIEESAPDDGYRTKTWLSALDATTAISAHLPRGDYERYSDNITMRQPSTSNDVVSRSDASPQVLWRPCLNESCNRKHVATRQSLRFPVTLSPVTEVGDMPDMAFTLSYSIDLAAILSHSSYQDWDSIESLRRALTLAFTKAST